MTIHNTNITINVKNLDTSIAFYVSIGFELKKRWDNYYAQLIAPGITIGLHPSNDVSPSNNSGNVSIGFTTTNFEDTKSELSKLSITFEERQENGGQFLNFSDPDGTSLYFIKPNW